MIELSKDPGSNTEKQPEKQELYRFLRLRRIQYRQFSFECHDDLVSEGIVEVPTWLYKERKQEGFRRHSVP